MAKKYSPYEFKITNRSTCYGSGYITITAIETTSNKSVEANIKIENYNKVDVIKKVLSEKYALIHDLDNYIKIGDVL